MFSYFLIPNYNSSGYLFFKQHPNKFFIICSGVKSTDTRNWETQANQQIQGSIIIEIITNFDFILSTRCFYTSYDFDFIWLNNKYHIVIQIMFYSINWIILFVCICEYLYCYLCYKNMNYSIILIITLKVIGKIWLLKTIVIHLRKKNILIILNYYQTIL